MHIFEMFWHSNQHKHFQVGCFSIIYWRYDQSGL